MAVTTFAAIDVGSYDLELTIYELSAKNGIQVVDHIRQAAAAGKDTYRQGKIGYALIDEMCQILKGFADVMQVYRISAYRAYATSALREARNNKIVLDQIRVRTGIEVKILSNSEQRFLCYKAIASKENEFQKIIQKGTAITDVGSGSVQLSLFDKDALVTTQYLRLGALRIRETLGSADADDTSMNQLIEELADNDIQTFKKLFLKDRDICNIIATGICALYLNRRVSAAGHSDRISAQEFAEFYASIRTMTPEQIGERYDIPLEYAYLMLPSMTVYSKMFEITGAEMLWVPGVNLCDGIAAEYAEQKKLMKFTHDFSEDILVAARNIAKRYMGNKRHTAMLEKTVLSIFDCMKKYHGLGKRERLLLQISAILHDCGKYISMRTPADCAFHIIMSTEIIGISHEEREIVANVVKYNTVDFSYEEDPESNRDPYTNVLIAKLTAILRIANAMDRSHKQKFDNIRTTFKNQQLIITTESLEDITLEKALFEKKADFFEEVYGIRPILKQRKGV